MPSATVQDGWSVARHTSLEHIPEQIGLGAVSCEDDFDPEESVEHFP